VISDTNSIFGKKSLSVLTTSFLEKIVISAHNFIFGKNRYQCSQLDFWKKSFSVTTTPFLEKIVIGASNSIFGKNPDWCLQLQNWKFFKF
jgi:hypothetical protein